MTKIYTISPLHSRVLSEGCVSRALWWPNCFPRQLWNAPVYCLMLSTTHPPTRCAPHLLHMSQCRERSQFVATGDWWAGKRRTGPRCLWPQCTWSEQREPGLYNWRQWVGAFHTFGTPMRATPDQSQSTQYNPKPVTINYGTAPDQWQLTTVQLWTIKINQDATPDQSQSTTV